MLTLTPSELLLLALLIIFALPYALWRIFRTDYFAPLVVVQIGLGVLLGPGVMGQFFPQLYQTIFTANTITGLNAMAMWSVMIFVCLAGMELDLKLAWTSRRESLLTAGLALLAPFLLGALSGFILLGWHADYWLGSHAHAWQFVLGLGMACAVTALPILVLFLAKLGLLKQAFGQRILRYASIDDLAIWAVLALILMDFNRLLWQLGFLLGFLAAAKALRAWIPRLPANDRWPVLLIFLLLAALLSDACGLHFMIGAFLAGVIMDADWFEEGQIDAIRHYVLLLLMPVFFLSTGLRTQFEWQGMSVWWIFAASLMLLVASIAGKYAGVWLAGRLLGWSKQEVWVIAWLLQTKALIMIIFASVLLDRAIISQAMFTALLLMALMSTMLTIPMVRTRRGFDPNRLSQVS
jgi:Kef-type K+ transport system membrane component KefB